MTINTITNINDLNIDIDSITGDFKHFENENGNGIIVKLDTGSIGDIYRICGKECKCLVECMNDDDCLRGNDICEKYECVDKMMMIKRREIGTGNGESERKYAQVIYVVPMVMCIFGVFSTMYLAREYGEMYFNDICEEECPSSSNSIEVDLENPVKEFKKEYIYRCTGSCDITQVYVDNARKKMTQEKLTEEEIIQLLPEDFKDLEYKGGTNEMMDWVIKTHMMEAYHMCDKAVIIEEVISSSQEEAVIQFSSSGQIRCQGLDYKWIVDPDEKSVYVDQNVCDLVLESIKCVVK